MQWNNIFKCSTHDKYLTDNISKIPNILSLLRKAEVHLQVRESRRRITLFLVHIPVDQRYVGIVPML